MSNLDTDEMSDQELFQGLKEIAQKSIVQAVTSPSAFTPAPLDPKWHIMMNFDIVELSKEEAMIFLLGAKAAILWQEQQATSTVTT